MDEETANAWLEEHFAEWVRALRPRVEKMACSGAVITMPVTPALTRPDGIIADQALATLADTAMMIACGGYFRAFRPVSATNFDIQFLRPARGEQISCTATLSRGSKSLIFTRAVLTAEPSGKEVATATATFTVT